MAKRKKIDWERCHADYSTGLFRLTDLSRKYDVSRAAITKKAKVEGWVKSTAIGEAINAGSSAAAAQVVKSASTDNLLSAIRDISLERSDLQSSFALAAMGYRQLNEQMKEDAALLWKKKPKSSVELAARAKTVKAMQEIEFASQVRILGSAPLIAEEEEGGQEIIALPIPEAMYSGKEEEDATPEPVDE